MDSNSFKGPLGKSVISLVVILLFTCLLVSNIVSPVLNTSREAKETQTDSLITLHGKYVAMDIARFNGRSPFFKPIRAPRQAPTPVPVPIPEPEDIPDPIDPGPPAPPVDYFGPKLIAIIGEEAWFRGTGTGENAVIRLKIGEEQDGLTLVATAEPSMATVEYRRGVYEIDLFMHSEDFFRVDAPAITTPDFLEEVDDPTEESPST